MAFVSRAISTGKMRENTRLRLVFPLGIFSSWNDIIYVSITALTRIGNVQFVKKKFKHLDIACFATKLLN